MDPAILNPDVQQFIDSQIGGDITKLALSKNPFPDVAFIDILAQVSAKTKAKEKLPTWFNSSNIIYPSKVSVEQTSSELTARYKSELVSGASLIDLTGGFGVDDYYFSKKVDSVVHCEINGDLSEITKHNFRQLNVANIECIQGDSHLTLKSLNKSFDWIYVDPSRRNETKGKVFYLKDCLPNVPGNLELYFSFSENILMKTSPLLDLSAGLNELSQVKSIHIVAVRNEVKELVWEFRKSYSGPIKIHTSNIETEKADTFDFVLDQRETPVFGLPNKYLYEPNAAIMKSGGFDQLGNKYDLKKLHKHSHLYTFDALIEFPGRIFEITKVLPYSKVGMKSVEQLKKANITVRNFPDSVESIRKKWKIGDGGNTYCFFTTDQNDNKIVLICTKILQ